MIITVWPVSRVEINFLEILQTCRKYFSRAWQSDKCRFGATPENTEHVILYTVHAS